VIYSRLFGTRGAVKDDDRTAGVPEWLREQPLRKFAVRYADLLESSRRVVSSGSPLVIGPWMSEVGYELLYWIPMLRFLHAELGWNADRAYVVSRGGASLWYEGLALHGCDILDLMPLDDYNARNERRWKSMHGSQKQKRRTPVDHDVLESSLKQLRIQEHAGFHPKLMFKTLNFYWRGILGLEWYDSLTRFAPLSVPDLGIRDRLPPDYFAVKFYFRPSFPDTTENRAFIGSLIRYLRQFKPVVVMESGVQYDEHAEYRAEGGDNGVVRLDLSTRPAANLALQSEVIARSAGFFGTYGGLAYLPMHFNVPSTCFVSDDEKVFLLHRTAAERACSIFRRQHGYTNARIHVLDTAEAQSAMTAGCAFLAREAQW
jgi:hypothetical protein